MRGQVTSQKHLTFQLWDTVNPISHHVYVAFHFSISVREIQWPFSSILSEELVYEYAKIILGVMTSSPEPHGKVGKMFGKMEGVKSC